MGCGRMCADSRHCEEPQGRYGRLRRPMATKQSREPCASGPGLLRPYGPRNDGGGASARNLRLRPELHDLAHALDHLRRCRIKPADDRLRLLAIDRIERKLLRRRVRVKLWILDRLPERAP